MPGPNHPWKRLGKLYLDQGRAIIDLSGLKFGRLTVIDRSNKRGEIPVRWNCLCECGKSSVVRTDCLTNGATTSCGCYQDEVRRRKRK